MARKIAEEAPKEETSVDTQPKKKRKYFFKFIIFLIIVGLAGATAYYYKQYKKIKDNPQVVSQEEVQFVVSELGKFMELPDGTPSLATIQDKEKLKDQNFFRKAENGDKVLIYADAKQAILYRPSAKKIIEVAPLILDNGNNNNSSANSSEGASQDQNSGLNQETSQGE